ncbi:NmrA family NAD(P)-binding protein [Chitinophaga arvensicola]|uniref:Uncharacterized conserved protein YbjT, contains NAD(P)-binding and DUF2867 domains n=1 Tax=Chitinophaga arvensicola TaxID=29529 RepID=A0A1I0S9W5_9BACT|nr:NAD(P)H-binding protein [Chitinophaga arvensicola]SEW53118.1 Uncharacterized conserved protein YbjT, contains NAD(P)-binding and DUF2867 domains [Chitinophaga arvensicola]
MNIVLTGSLGNIGKPLTVALVKKGHTVTVISSKPERQKEIEALGAKAAIGSIEDVGFLSETFKNADIVYLMETLETAGSFFDKNVDFIATINKIGQNYKQAVETAGVKKVVHLSSVSGNTNQGNGILIFHYNVEKILQQLPADVSVKFMRPVSFYTNMFAFIRGIKAQGAIVQNYGGDEKAPWVSPLDIAEVVAEEMDSPFHGRTIRYIASDEFSPNEAASLLGEAIGKQDLTWQVIPDQQLLDNWQAAGMNEQIAQGFIEMQASMRGGLLFEDYYKNRPALGKVKLTDFVKQFAAVYHQS